MLLSIGLALLFGAQVQTGAPARRLPVVRDSSADSVLANRERRRAARNAVTADIQRSAYRDPASRELLGKARIARLSMDSALTAYDAMAYSRISAGMSLLKLGRDRLLFRHESAARVRWQLGVGAWMDIKGRRTTVPAAPKEAQDEIRGEMNDPDLNAGIPYYPGYEPLWVGSSMARAQVNDREIVNPLADGAEAYYTFEAGDSARFTLPDKSVINLREIRFRPREAKWNVAVGSLWLDVRTGQVVRAAYRLSVPMDIWEVAKAEDPTSMDDVPVWVKPMITPMRAEVSAVAVEYGLHQGRFWLPRVRLAEGNAQVSFMRVPFRMEQSFTYSSVNARDSLPPLPVVALTPRVRMDTMSAEQRKQWADSVAARARATAMATRDSIRLGLKVPARRVRQCDTASTQVRFDNRSQEGLRVGVRTPCDTDALAISPDLPRSAYDKGEELFSIGDLEALKAEALSLGAQAPFSLRIHLLPPPTIAYGLSMMRYNRVEGLSVGASIEQQFGGGYSGQAIARFGFADHEPNIELTATRTNVVKSISVSGYNRLVSANDWGHPLTFGSSFGALMFGRDEGFYYRSTGAELGGMTVGPLGSGARLEWRLFAERQRTAVPRASYAVNGAELPANLVAWEAPYLGAGTRITNAYGLDPRGLRVFTDFRVEAARGDSAYGRAALDLTMSRGLGLLAGAVTLAGGTSIGALPPQRLWYLGGSQTVRGQSPDVAQSGNVFWMTRAEIGYNDAGVRPTVFADLGWVGSREKMSEVGRPLSGVGAGVSFMDGLFRFDVSRGLYPRKQYRVDLYLESKF
jgi:hypothetical protein